MTVQLKDAYQDFRNKYHPMNKGIATSVIFIGEAPPFVEKQVEDDFIKTGDPDKIPFFYNPKEHDRCNRLGFHLSKLFFNSDVDEWKTGDLKQRFLAKFQESGFILIDLCEVPLTGSSAERRIQLDNSSKTIANRIQSELHQDVIVLLMRVDEVIPKQIKGDEQHYRAVPFPTRFGIEPLKNALKELGYSFDANQGWRKTVQPQQNKANSQS